MYRWLLPLFVLALPTRAFAQATPLPTPAPASSTPAPPDPAAAPAETPGEETAPPATAVPAPTPAPPAAEADEPEIRGKSGFMDVRLNLTFTNENLFAKPGETIPSVPGWRFGSPNSLGTLFFDNYDTRYSGYETLSHAVLYKDVTTGPWEVEGALVIRINDVAESRIDLSDAGSYVRVAWWKDPTHKDPERVSLVAFPTSSDRMRLGYSYRLSWGGTPEYQRSRTSVPGLKLQYDWGNAYVYGGAKSAVVLDRSTAEERAVMAFLGGAGIDLTDMFRVEINGGWFDRGPNELQDVLTEEVNLYGASAQVAVHDGMPVGSSIDYTLYRNDPERVGRLFRKAEYPGGLSWLVKSEATVIGQTLKDPERTGSTVVQYGKAWDVNARVKLDHTRFRLDAQVRDLAFILHSTPSLPTYSDFPMEYDKTANYFIAAGADQNFRDQLTLGMVLGLDMPATLTTPTGVIPGDTVGGNGTSTAVIRGGDDITILPEGESAAPQLAAKFTARLDFAELFASILDVYYTYDPNQTRLRREGPEDLLTREFGEFNQLGVNITLQARF